jgi:uncharacterized membrane protein YoaT (DUF817 family)
MVPLGKLGSWYLLMLLSFVLVTTVHRPAEGAQTEEPQADAARPAVERAGG